ncbi:MAG: efflux RND transporter periplasmic adaptor subunit, partial [bacterium]|nr:efflux RND transporter periplasmic adaptor subunit [bacterium]
MANSRSCQLSVLVAATFLVDFSIMALEVFLSERAIWPVPEMEPRFPRVNEKHIVDGAHIEAGNDVYHIGDLSRIWVTAEIYEYDAPWIEVGQPAQMELTYAPGRTIEGRVAYIYPTIDKATRTLSVRLEFENPDNRLKPGMFATLYIQFQRRDDVLVVPTEAILH